MSHVYYPYIPQPLPGLVSTGNSSVTPLNASATFTGTSVDLLNWAAIIISIYTDKPSANSGLVAQFSHDDATWMTSDTFSVQPNEIFSISLQPTYRYFRITYTNGAENQSVFRLQTILKTTSTLSDPFKVISEISGQDDAALVKAVLTDRYGHAAEFSVMRDFKVAEAHRLEGANFQGATIDTNFWTTTLSGTATSATQANDSLTLASGTDNSGYAHLASARVARFVFAHPHFWRGIIRLASVTAADCTRRWGVYTVTAGVPQNGFYFEISAAGVLSIVTCIGGTPTPVVSGAFNGDFAQYVVDTNVHVYEIHYFLMRVEYFVDGVLVHVIKTETRSTLPSGEYQLPIGITTRNSAGGTTSGLVQCMASTVMRIGKDETQPKSAYQSGTVAALVLKRGNGILHSVAISNVTNNSVVTLWDNTAASGTTLWSSGAMSNSTVPFSVDLHQVAFYTGLTLSITAANCDVTAIYE